MIEFLDSVSINVDINKGFPCTIIRLLIGATKIWRKF